MADGGDANRRPIAVRSWPLFHACAAWLAARGVAPNAISVSSIVFGVVAGVSLAATGAVEPDWPRRALWLLAAVAIQLRLVANLLDGLVAVEGGKKTAVGELYNEVPDRASDVAILAGAGWAAGSDVVLGLAAAVVAVLVAYVRAIGASVGVGQVFLGPLAKQQRMAVITLACVLHGLLPRGLQSLGDDRATWILLALVLIVLGGLWTAVRRLMRIARLMREAANEE